MSTKQTWSHQPPAIEFLNSQPNTLLEAKMGTGKSFIAVKHVSYAAAHPTGRTLILCPASVLGVWRREFTLHAPGQFELLILDGKQPSVKKAEMVAEAIRLQLSRRVPLIVVVNYETFWRPELAKVILSVTWDKMIDDESHRLKSHGATCSKEAWKMGHKRFGGRTLLTGTFMPKDPGDAFAQMRVLDDRVLGKYWTHFRNHYAIMNPYIPNAVKEWVRLDELATRIAPYRHFIGSEVLVLPGRQDIQVDVAMSPAGMKAYKQMKKDSILEIEKQVGEGVDIATAVGSNGAVQFLRLLQLAQGYVTDETKTNHQTDSEKRKVLLDLIMDAGEPVCVYGWFKHDLEVVQRCCEIAGLRYGEISGARKDLTPHAKMPDDIDVMGVQCKSGSSGIDLTRARIGVVLNSGLLSPGDFDQMMARQYRPGQDREVIFYHLVSRGTVEQKLIDERGKRRDIIDAMLCEIKEEETPW